MSSTPPIRAFNVRTASGLGGLVALCSISIGDWLTVHDCELVQPPDQLNPWPRLPRAPWTGPRDRKDEYPLIELPHHVEHQIKKEMIRAYEEHRYAVA